MKEKKTVSSALVYVSFKRSKEGSGPKRDNVPKNMEENFRLIIRQREGGRANRSLRRLEGTS